MIPDALLSCTLLLVGSGSSIYRLMKHSSDHFSELLPQFILASFGIGALGARSLFGIVYNFFWREYSIDPLVIEEELTKYENDRNFIDWALSTFGLTGVVCSFYQHHNCILSGAFAISSLTVIEVICLYEHFIEKTESQDDSETQTIEERFPSIPNSYVPTLWVVSNELFGQAVGNDYFRIANIVYFISSVHRPEGFYQGWTIKNSVNDYLMLTFVILSTEALVQTH